MNKRIVGIDLLKILSMLMIVCLHVLLHGGVSSSLLQSSNRYYIYYVINIICYCSVDCYAIISGYLNYKTKNRIRNIIKLYIQVFFYSFIFAIISSIITNTDFDLKYVFPVYKRVYWYFSCYFGMMILSPLIDVMVKKSGKRIIEQELVAVFVFFSLIPTLLVSDVFRINGGYSVIWLIILYFIGASIREYDFFSNISNKKLLYLNILMIFTTFMWKYSMELMNYNDYANQLLRYDSPTILIYAISLFLLLKKLVFKNQFLNTAISKLSSLTFGVYLIHDNPVFRSLFIKGKFSFLTDYQYNVITSLLLFTIICLSIYVFCFIIDFFRLMLFRFFKLNIVEEMILNLVKRNENEKNY